MIRRQCSLFCVLLVPAVLLALAASWTARAQRGPAVRVEMRVAASADDAEEDTLGNVDRGSSDLELVFDHGSNQVVGIRFNGVPVPTGAAILGAHIQFQVDETGSDATFLRIKGEAGDRPQHLVPISTSRPSGTADEAPMQVDQRPTKNP